MSNSKPKVSVLITTYNHVDHIGKCLDSILEQQCDFDFEVVLGEDGSDDGTQEICQAYAQKFPDVIRLKIRDQKKKVYLYGRATGKYNLLKVMQEGNGEYFAFCDGDDYWTDKYKLQRQVDFMDANPSYSFCATDRMVILEGKVVRDERLQKAFVGSGGKPIEIVKNNFFSPYLVKSNTILFRRDCLDFDLLQERYTEVKDTFIYYLLLNKGKGIIQPWITSDYRIHQGGRWSSLSRFGMAKMNHHTIRGMYLSYLGADAEVENTYRGSLFSYFVASVKNKQWKDAGIALTENPSVLLKKLLTRGLRKMFRSSKAVG
jgi:glycosyltransferase involved in cell wall biosynthesis